MKQSLGESLVTREAPSGWGPFRFAATPRAWLRSADGTTQEVLFADHWGVDGRRGRSEGPEDGRHLEGGGGAWKWRNRGRHT